MTAPGGFGASNKRVFEPSDVSSIQRARVGHERIPPLPENLVGFVAFNAIADFIALADIYRGQFVIRAFSGPDQNVDTAFSEFRALAQLGPSGAWERDCDSRPVGEFDKLGPF